MADADVVVIGSGINGLSAAALLAKAGWSAVVLEREDVAGGCIRTAEITVPGYHHDVFSAWHPLFVGGPVYAQLAPELEARGLTYLNTDLPTATAFPDGSASFLLRSADANAAEFDRHAAGDGDAWRRTLDGFWPTADLTFGLLGTELWSGNGVDLVSGALERLGRAGLIEFVGQTLVSARDWLETEFASEGVRGLIAPWVLHTGLGPDAASSGYMAQLIAVAVQEGGMPIPRGGGAKLVDALTSYLRDRGGEVRTGADVEHVAVAGGRAVGVRLAGGETVSARRAVIANVTPTQLYARLLDGVPGVSDAVSERARRFRYGRAEMQIDYALSAPARWQGDDRLQGAALVHLTSGLDGVSRAVNEAERGLLPAEPTVVLGQPLTMDVSRAPDGAGLLWIQLQELPRRIKGDAAGDIDTGDGSWSDEVRERYADRVQAAIARHLPDLESSIVARTVLGPADLERANVNLVGGDPYSGALALDQNFLWRASGTQPGHGTPIDGLWHVGASTHPGPGLGGGSGALVAQALLHEPKRLEGVRRLARAAKAARRA